MPILGRKPSGKDIGVGTVGAGDARATIVGALPQSGWLQRIGVRGGGNSGANPTVQLAVYTVSGSGTVATLVATTPAFVVTAKMYDSAGGADYAYEPTTPIQLNGGQTYAVAVRASGAQFNHGMDHSGTLLHRRFGVSSFPGSFAANQVDPQGRISAWLDVATNNRPNTPSGLSPANDATVTQTAPTLGMDFRDPDEGTSGDVVSAYQFEIWNEAKSSRIQTSGKLTSSTAQKNARRVTWTPAALTAGVYVVRGTVWDQQGVASPVAEWSFRINIGGTFTAAVLRADYRSDQDSTVTTSQSPDVTATVELPAGVYIKYFRCHIRQRRTNQLVRGPYEFTWSTANVGSGTASFNLSLNSASRLGGNPLARGEEYRVEIIGRDTSGVSIPWFHGDWFGVNAPPATPTRLSPQGGAFTSRPRMEGYINDPDGPNSELFTQIRVRRVSTGDIATHQSSVQYDAVKDVFYAIGNSSSFPQVDETYEWSMRGTDKFGAESDWSGWIQVKYVSPPTFGSFSPPSTSSGSNVSTGRPTLFFGVSRPISHVRWRIYIERTLFANDSWDLAHDSDWIVDDGTVASYQLPPAVLVNNKRFRILATVRTTDGLETHANTQWYNRLTYPATPALTGVTTVKYPGTFESLEDDRYWSRTRTTWDDAPLASVPAAEFRGWIIRRENMLTQEIVPVGLIEDRASRVFEDKTPDHLVPYRYHVTALKFVNGIDWIETADATGETVSIELQSSVITSMSDDNVSIPLLYWDKRRPRRQYDRDILPTWGRLPVGFQGPQNYLVLDGDFQIFEDDYGSYTVDEVLAALEDVCAVSYDADGRPIPKVVYYRDPRRRGGAYMTVTGFDPDDQHDEGYAEISLELTEIASSSGTTVIAGVLT